MQSLICSIGTSACFGAVRRTKCVIRFLCAMSCYLEAFEFHFLFHRQPSNHYFISYYFFPQVSTACIQGSKTFAYSVLNVVPIPSIYKDNANGAGMEIPGRLVKATT